MTTPELTEPTCPICHTRHYGQRQARNCYDWAVALDKAEAVQEMKDYIQQKWGDEFNWEVSTPS